MSCSSNLTQVCFIFFFHKVKEVIFIEDVDDIKMVMTEMRKIPEESFVEIIKVCQRRLVESKGTCLEEENLKNAPYELS